MGDDRWHPPDEPSVEAADAVGDQAAEHHQHHEHDGADEEHGQRGDRTDVVEVHKVALLVLPPWPHDQACDHQERPGHDQRAAPPRGAGSVEAVARVAGEVAHAPHAGAEQGAGGVADAHAHGRDGPLRHRRSRQYGRGQRQPPAHETERGAGQRRWGDQGVEDAVALLRGGVSSLFSSAASVTSRKVPPTKPQPVARPDTTPQIRPALRQTRTSCSSLS